MQVSYPLPGKLLNPEETAIIGVDLSLTGTGVVVLLPDGTVHAERLIQVKSRGTKRLMEILERVVDTVQDVVMQFDVLVVQEEYGASGNYQMKMGPLHGVIDAMWFNANVPVMKINPMHLKQFVCGKGNAQKEDIKLTAYKRWGYDNLSNDIVDAFCMTQVGRMMLCQSEITSQYQRDLAKKILEHAVKYCPDLDAHMAFMDRYSELGVNAAGVNTGKRRGKKCQGD